MPARKRGREEMEAADSASAEPTGLLSRLRNTWYFANVFQFMQLFGAGLKVDESFDIEDFEEECLKTDPSTKLSEFGHTLIKACAPIWERGSFEEIARREFDRRKPDEENPFGNKEEESRSFASFAIFYKLRVLHTITQWIWDDPARFRQKISKMEENDLTWRIEEFGWDAEDRVYFLLDDNRLYRRTPKPLPPTPPPQPKGRGKAKPKPKAAPKPKSRGTRRSARGRVESSEEPEDEEAMEVDPEERPSTGAANNAYEAEEDGLGGDKWECVCITLNDYETFLEHLKRSRDANEKYLHKRVTQHILPIIQDLEDQRSRKVAKRQRDLLTLEKMATAKRSSRLAGKAEKEKEEQLTKEAEEKRTKDLVAAKKDLERQKQMEEDRQSRMMTREQRIKDREFKRILQEEEVKRLEAEKEALENGEVDAKKSERQLYAELKKRQEALEELKEEEEDWVFDCARCGVHGKNVDDGKHSIACERCNVWQHSACLGLSREQAESEDFIFVCSDCKRREEDAKKPKIAPLRFPAPIASPPQQKSDRHSTTHGTIHVAPIQGLGPAEAAHLNGNLPAPGHVAPQKLKRSSEESNGIGSSSSLPPMKKFKEAKPANHAQMPASSNGTTMHTTFLNGPTLSPQGQVERPVNGNRPPGLISPQRPGHGMSGYSPSQPMQFGPPLQPNVARPQPATGTSPQKQSPAPRTPAQNDPFRNTFSGQVPGSASSRVGPRESPLASQDTPRMPPPITPNASFQSNGSFQNAIPSTPASQPVIPQKQVSAAPSPAPSTTLHAASPSMAPTLRPDAAVAGMSPVKNSPPRSASRGPNSSPILPPTQKLMPSPQAESIRLMTGAESPVKASAPPPPAAALE